METKTINFVTEPIPPNDADFGILKNGHSQLIELYEKIGRLHIKRKELELEFANVEKTILEAEEDFKTINEALRVSMSKLEKRYPKGQIDLKNETITYPQ